MNLEMNRATKNMAKTPSQPSFIGVLDSRGEERLITREDFCSQLGVEGWVRLHSEDYAGLATLGRELVHFNLEITDNEIGKRYAVVPILRRGLRRGDGTEQLPIVDMSRYRIVVCVEVIQGMPIKLVTDAHFQNSLSSIRSGAELEKALLYRYSPMYPDAKAEDIIARGTALSRFSFVDEAS